jgi:hypothetical protein
MGGGAGLNSNATSGQGGAVCGGAPGLQRLRRVHPRARAPNTLKDACRSSDFPTRCSNRLPE